MLTSLSTQSLLQTNSIYIHTAGWLGGESSIVDFGVWTMEDHTRQILNLGLIECFLNYIENVKVNLGMDESFAAAAVPI